MDIKSKLFAINGLATHVVVGGTGSPVLLLHGFPDSARLWRPDLRGYGQTDAPLSADQYRIVHIVSDMLELLDRLEVESKLRLVGHDWGAIVGWALSAAVPERVDRLVAMSVGHPAGFWSGGLRQAMLSWYMIVFQLHGLAEALFSAADWALFRRLVRNHPEAEHWIRDLFRPGRLAAAMNWYRTNLFKQELIPPVQVPVMGMWSAQDPFLSEAQMLASRHHVGAAWRYERIEKAGHWLPLDVPDRVNNLLLDFLKT